MSKPDWKDAPDWANYLSREPGGEWYWSETKPKVHCDGFWETEIGRWECANPDWENDWYETLEERPND